MLSIQHTNIGYFCSCVQLFTGLFDIEAALKLIGLGFSEYFRGSWNRFDFAIAVLSTASVVLERFDVTGTDFLRAFRLVRKSRVMLAGCFCACRIHVFALVRV